MNGYDNRKTSFAVGFSSVFVLKDIKMMVTGIIPRLINKKNFLRVLFLCVALCMIENCHSLKITSFFRRYSFMQVLYFMQSCILGTQPEKCAPHPRSRAREGGSMFLTVHWKNFMLLFGTCEMP